MEGSSGDSGSEYFAGESGSEYFDCATDRSRSSSEEAEEQLGRIGARRKEMALEVASGDFKGASSGDEVQRAPTIRRFRRIGNNRRTTENAGGEKASSVEGGDSEVERGDEEKQTGDGFEICGYELRAPQSDHALKRLSMDATLQRQEFLRKTEVKPQSMRSKVQDEVMQFLFGPPDAKTPDEEKYEIVEQEEVVRGTGHTGILFRFSMWATLGFIALVLGGRRAQVGCSELFPNVRERDPVPKVIVRNET